VNRKLVRMHIDDQNLDAPSVVGEDLFINQTIVGSISSQAEKDVIAWVKKNGFQETHFLTRDGISLRMEH